MEIYVGNLAKHTTEDQIREVFSAYGRVYRVVLMTDSVSHLPRGNGLVEMERAEECELVVAELDGVLIGKQALFVREARPQAVRGRKPYRGPGRS